MTTRQQSDRVDALAQRLAQAVANQEMDLVSSRFVGLYPTIWRILAGGRAASSAEIAASMVGLSPRSPASSTAPHRPRSTGTARCSAQG